MVGFTNYLISQHSIYRTIVATFQQNDSFNVKQKFALPTRDFLPVIRIEESKKLDHI